MAAAWFQRRGMSTSSLLPRWRLTRCLFVTGRNRRTLCLLILATAAFLWLLRSRKDFSDEAGRELFEARHEADEEGSVIVSPAASRRNDPTAHLPQDDSPQRSPTALGLAKSPEAAPPPPPPLILWWDPIPGSQHDDEPVRCGQRQCRKTTDRSRWQEQQIMMISFYGSSLSMSELPVPRRATDLWALFNDESPKNLDFLLCHRSVLELFNYTSTYSRTSDLPFPLQWLHSEADITDSQYYVPVSEKTRLQRLPDPGQRLAPVIYVQSDCRTPTDRDHYVTMLQQFVAVDSYGPCVHNRQFPDFESLSFESQGNMAPMTSEAFYRFVARYKFAIAMENAAAPDYVTEKFWRPVHLGVVPIVFGASNIRDFLPGNNSALLVEEFTTVEDLAKAIRHYDQDDAAYEALLDHKVKGQITNPALLRMLQEARQPTAFFAESSKSRSSPQSLSLPLPRRSSDIRFNVFEDYDCFLCHKLHQAVQHARPRRRSNAFASSLTPAPALPRAQTLHAPCPTPGRFNATGAYVRDEVSERSWGSVWRYSGVASCLMRRLIAQGRRLSQRHFDSQVSALVGAEAPQQGPEGC